MDTMKTSTSRFAGTDAQLNNQAAHNRLAVAWQSCTYSQRWGWAQIAPFVPDWDNTRGSTPLSAYQAFQSLGRARQALSLNIVLDAPPTPTIPPSPGRLSLGGSVGGDSAFLLLGGDAYPVPLQIWACAPAVEGASEPPIKKYAVLCTAPGIGKKAIDLRPAYENKYGSLCEGMKIWVRICPISLAGFRGQPRPVSCVMAES